MVVIAPLPLLASTKKRSVAGLPQECRHSMMLLHSGAAEFRMATTEALKSGEANLPRLRLAKPEQRGHRLHHGFLLFNSLISSATFEPGVTGSIIMM